MGWFLTLLGAALAVACCRRSWRPSARVTWAATLVCLCFAAATVTIGVGQFVGTMRAPDAAMVCVDDVSPALVVGGQEVRAGVNPYTSYNVMKAEKSLGCPFYRITPLRTGMFATQATLPSDRQDDVAARAAVTNPSAGGVLLGFNYPAGSALVGMVGAHGVVILDTLALLLAVALLSRRAPAGLRQWVALALLAQTGVLVLVGPVHPDALVVALLVVACSSRRVLVGGLALGVACATKQTAWFIAAPLLVLAFRDGAQHGLRYAGVALASFAAINLPFAIGDPGAWLAGVSAPLISPAFTLSSGPITAFGPVASQLHSVETAGSAVALLSLLAGTALAWRGRGGWAEGGVVVAMLGLWDGPRGLAYYMGMFGMVAVAMCVRNAAQRASDVRYASAGVGGEPLIARSAAYTTAGPMTRT